MLRGFQELLDAGICAITDYNQQPITVSLNIALISSSINATIMISGLITNQVADFTWANLKTVAKNLLQPLAGRNYIQHGLPVNLDTHMPLEESYLHPIPQMGIGLNCVSSSGSDSVDVGTEDNASAKLESTAIFEV
jgi:hypothetical protein